MSTHIKNLFPFLPRHPPPPNSVVLVTGAGSGIGRALSLRYSKRCCKLVLVDLNPLSLQETAILCDDTLQQQCDVTDLDAVQRVVAKTIEIYQKLDILILCAGLGAHHLFARTNDLTIFEKLLKVNFFGYLNFTHCAYHHLCKSPIGHLIAITSFSAECGLPYRTAYCASKFAVTGFLEALRSEMTVTEKEIFKQKEKKSFDITIVCPPTIDTNLRKSALTPDPQLKYTEKSSKMTVDQCADAIIDAADRRLRKAFLTFPSFLASYARPIVPDLMDRFIWRKAKL